MSQNLERVREEFSALKKEYASISDRFKYVTFPGMKSRVPDHLAFKYSRNNNLFHLLAAFIEETYDKAPRICMYVTVGALGIYLVSFFI